MASGRDHQPGCTTDVGATFHVNDKCRIVTPDDAEGDTSETLSRAACRQGQSGGLPSADRDLCGIGRAAGAAIVNKLVFGWERICVPAGPSAGIVCED
jgi:hypothetical protein